MFFFKKNCINQACKSSSCFLNFSSSWRNEISLSCFSEKYEMQSLDVDLRDVFCEPSPFSFLFLVSPHVSSETFCMFFYLHKLLFNFFFQLLLSVLQYQLHRIAQSNRVVLHLFQCDWVLFRMLYLLLSFLIYIFLTNRLYLSRTDLGGTLKKVGLMNLK